MPTQKKRRQLIRAKRKRRTERQKLVILTKEERQRLMHFKKIGQWELARQYGRGFNDRQLAEVNHEHGKDFVQVVKELSKRFPNETIKILDEGAGNSTFVYDLKKKVVEASNGGIKVSVAVTDINYDIHHRNEQANRDNLGRMISPEELVKRFGPNSFHLVVSTYGGVNYTPISRLKAIANIISLLKPGGVASIASCAPDTFTRPWPLIFGRGEDAKNLIKAFPNVHFQDEVLPNEFFKGLFHWYVLTIKKLS